MLLTCLKQPASVRRSRLRHLSLLRPPRRLLNGTIPNPNLNRNELIVSPTYVSTLVATIVPDVTLLAPVIEPGGTELVAYDPTTA